MMLIVSPLAFTVQLSIVLPAVLGLVFIFLLLYKRRISEGLFYIWAIAFVSILVVGMSPGIRLFLTTTTGFESALSVILFISLVLLIGTSLIYSVLISQVVSSIEDITSYVAELRLDVDEGQRPALEARPEGDNAGNGQSEEEIQLASEIRRRQSAGGIF